PSEVEGPSPAPRGECHVLRPWRIRRGAVIDSSPSLGMTIMERHRIDHWLKLVCLFKHRADATEACRGGKVKINGLRVKPASPVKEGDVVEFLLGTHFRRVIVAALPETQSSKEAARAMYVDETPKQEVDIA